MAKQTINIGAAANDGTGDPLRDAFDKANDNFTELYAAAADAGTGDGDMLSTNNLADVADVPTARDNLDVYSKEEVDAAIVDAGGGDLLSTNNLSDVADPAAAGANIRPIESLIVACSDETTALTAGTGKVSFRMPYAFTVTEVYASLVTAQATNGAGGIFTVDINEAGASILSTKLTIDNTETDSDTAATPAVISDASLARRALMTVDIDQIGDGTAKGLKITLVGHRT